MSEQFLDEAIELRETGIPGYLAGSDGLIYSKAWNWRGHAIRALVGALDIGGYLKVRLTHGDVRRKYFAHVLVCTAFHGPKPSPGHECRHLDGSRTHNKPGNLQWGTRSENALDRVRHGTQFRPNWQDPAYRAHMAAAKEAAKVNGGRRSRRGARI